VSTLVATAAVAATTAVAATAAVTAAIVASTGVVNDHVALGDLGVVSDHVALGGLGVVSDHVALGGLGHVADGTLGGRLGRRGQPECRGVGDNLVDPNVAAGGHVATGRVDASHQGSCGQLHFLVAILLVGLDVIRLLLGGEALRLRFDTVDVEHHHLTEHLVGADRDAGKAPGDLRQVCLGIGVNLLGSLYEIESRLRDIHLPLCHHSLHCC
jgi:hypothetical protein